MIFFTLIASYFRISVVAELQPASEIAHKVCISQLPELSSYFAELAALVCAQEFSTAEQRQLYVASGLIHLFVVSGAHFLLLESMLKFLFGKNIKYRKLILALLTVYAFMCKLSAPVCRSYFTLLINYFNSSINIRWNSQFKLLFSGLICLLLNPTWVTSLSLQLSWIAAIIVCATTEHLPKKFIFFRQSFFYFLMYPTISHFQIPQISSISANIFLAPLLEFFLFPLALIVSIFNFLYPLFDHSMYAFRRTLELFEYNSTPAFKSISTELIYFNWLLILVSHLFLHLYSINKNKNELKNRNQLCNQY